VVERGCSPARGRISGGERVCVELSVAQVDQVVRAASDGGNMSMLFSGLADVRAMLAARPDELENARLSRSLLAGLLMLVSFPSDGSFLSIAKLARTLDMSPSTTHRYVTTLLAVGLLERDPRTRQYRLADAG
jgi:DNA-binding transcriptional ArsR family regulator